MTGLTGLAADPVGYVALHDVLDESVADGLLSPREMEVRRTLRELCATDVAPGAEVADREHRFVEGSIAAIARAGLLGILVPCDLGGSGDSHVAYAVAMEEIAAACAATSLVFMTQMHAAYPIMTAGSPEVRERYVPGLADGTVIGALGITEPDAGSDVSGLRTTAVRAGDAYEITGSKTFITSGDRADVVVLFATVDRSLGRRGITAFALDGAAPGLTRGRPFDKLGMHGSTTAELFLDRVAVPVGSRLGDEGGGWAIVMRSVVKSRVSAAAQGVGLARAAYARAAHVLNALHGPAWPAETTFAMADLRGRILQARLLLWATARQIDQTGDADTAHVGVMKQQCTDLGFRAGVEAVRILGPYGDIRSLEVERCLRDAKVTQIYDGTNEVQRLLIGRDTATRMRTASAPSAD
ncbi:acyl-CoA dehydrogenase family protein [Nocardioides hungaricus]